MKHVPRCLLALLLVSVAPAQDKPAFDPTPRRATAEQLKTAQWIEGRVVIPLGTPPEERVTVLSDAAGLPAFDQHESPVDVEGRFRVAFAADAKRGKLRVQGRFLYLDPETAWKAGDPATDVRLKPLLGANLRGRVVLPEGMQPAERDEVLAADVELDGTPHSPGHQAIKRRARLAPDLGFEFPALPAAYDWTATIVAGPFVPFLSAPQKSEAGKALSIECALARGATVRGKVVDEAGKPMADAVLDVVSHSDPLAPAPRDVLTGRTKADGTFEIRGIAPGVATLWAKREGCIPVDKEIAALAAGETRADVTLLLRTGNVLTGRTLDAAGKALADVRVRVTQSRLGQADLVKEIVTGADGSFAVPGLGDERVDVLATREADAPGAGGATPARKRTLRATATQIEAASRDLVLTLIAGLVIEGRVHDDLGRVVLSYTVGARRATPDGKTTTDASGFPPSRRALSRRHLRVRGPRAGRVDVYAFGRGIVYEPAQRISVPYEGEPLLFVVRRPATVSGIVLDAQRKPVAGAIVEVQWTRPPLYKGAPARSRRASRAIVTAASRSPRCTRATCASSRSSPTDRRRRRCSSRSNRARARRASRS